MFGVGADVPVAPGSESIQLQQTRDSTAGRRYQSNVVTAKHLLLNAFCGPFRLILQEPDMTTILIPTVHIWGRQS